MTTVDDLLEAAGVHASLGSPPEPRSKRSGTARCSSTPARCNPDAEQEQYVDAVATRSPRRAHAGCRRPPTTTSS